MKRNVPIEQLLRWRLARAQSEVPVAPSAARLLKLARPWWEKWPEKYQLLAEQLSRAKTVHTVTTNGSKPGHSGNLVPALFIRGEEVLEILTRLLSFRVRDAKLRLNFQTEVTLTPPTPVFEAAFISNTTWRPLFSAVATASVDDEYRVETELPARLVRGWERLKVTDHMPFQMILHSGTNG